MPNQLKEDLIFYASYHSNSINKLVHIIFVPCILWSAFLVGTLTGELLPVSQFTAGWVKGDLAFIAASTYALYYIYLDLFAGVTAAAWLALFWVTSEQAAASLTTQQMWQLFGVMQFVSWTAQILAHKIAEGRSPALLDNLFQSFRSAPLFVWLEVLFDFGYKPELHKQIRSAAGKNIAQFRSAQKKN